MLNQVVIVGRLVSDPTVEEIEEGKKVATIVIAVPRSYKNVDGTYDTDFIKCILWNGIKESVYEYCKKGDIVGVKGRIQTTTYGTGTEENKYIMNIIAEKVSFLSSKRKEDQE